MDLPEMIFVGDATHTSDRTGPDGATVAANDIQRATEASLNGGFADARSTGELLK